MRATKSANNILRLRTRLNALGICPEKRVGIGQDVVFALSFTPAEASEEHQSGGGPSVACATVILARTPRDIPVQ